MLCCFILLKRTLCGNSKKRNARLLQNSSSHRRKSQISDSAGSDSEDLMDVDVSDVLAGSILISQCYCRSTTVHLCARQNKSRRVTVRTFTSLHCARNRTMTTTCRPQRNPSRTPGPVPGRTLDPLLLLSQNPRCVIFVIFASLLTIFHEWETK